MPLDLPSPPAASLASLESLVPHLRNLPGIAQHMPGLAAAFAQPEQQQTTKPLVSVPVYVLGADAIVDGTDLTGLKPVLWSHFLSPAQALVGRLMTADTGLESSQVESFFEGPTAEEFAKELDRLKAEPQVQDGEFELAELRVPAAHVSALWLKDKKGHAHVLIPFAGDTKAMKRGGRYSAADFLKALRPAAEMALRHADDAKGGN